MPIMRELLIYVVGGALIFSFFWLQDNRAKTQAEKITEVTAMVAEVEQINANLKQTLTDREAAQAAEIRILQSRHDAAVRILEERQKSLQQSQARLSQLQTETEKLRRENEAFKAWGDVVHPAVVGELFNKAAGSAGACDDNQDCIR